MAELIKPWSDGGNLSVTYDGDRDGSAIFESDHYEGIDREMSVTFKSGDIKEERIVRQEGTRQPIGLLEGGIFRVANGGRFGVLKESIQPALYEELEYAIFDGTQIYDTMLKGSNHTTIEIKFQRTNSTITAYLLGSYGTSSTRLTVQLDASGYWRYGKVTQAFNTRNLNLYEAKITPTSMHLGSTSVEYTANEFVTPFTLCVGGYTQQGEVKASSYRGHIYYFRMSEDGVVVADWIPVRRLSDGLECFWDKVTQSFVEPIIQ